ncbi:MAG: chemotaxis protein CheX [Oscillospiraceae bacterium]|nr:chemotaxis protein CheX [Oscillospiraceae bacterium]
MFAQFFGSYLLNEGIVTGPQLAKALDDKKNTKTRLGVLAINAGYLTAGQVEFIHQVQSTVDKRIGDIAVEMGFMTKEQVEELLSKQPQDYLILGQTLVNNGVMTNAQFEQAINDYKNCNALSEDDLNGDKTDKLDKIIADFYKVDGVKDPCRYTTYLTLLFKNLIRFVGDDFTPMNASVVTSAEYENTVSQRVKSEDVNAYTAICCDTDIYIKFAERFSEEKLDTADDFVNATVGEFLNLHNGLFIVNQSNELGNEMTLEPQEFVYKTAVALDDVAIDVPVAFSFGTVHFIISNL